MSTIISLDTPGEKPDENIACNLMPCKISFNGKCNVENFFNSYIRDKDGILSCSMRGHPLLGQKIKVPAGYKGIILKENKKTSMSEEDHCFKADGSFSEFTVWNWDKAPSDDDKIVKALQWLEVSSALHKPVSDYEDLKTENFKTGIKRKNSDK